MNVEKEYYRINEIVFSYSVSRSTVNRWLNDAGRDTVTEKLGNILLIKASAWNDYVRKRMAKNPD